MKPQPKKCGPGREGHDWPSNKHLSMLHVEDELQNGLGYWKGLAADASPFGNVGDLLWVRETWNACPVHEVDNGVYEAGYPYKKIATKKPDSAWVFYHVEKEHEGPWRPSIHMPRWASRITLKITDVRVERLQDISEEDAQSEGAERGMLKTMGGEFILHGGSYTCGFINLWQSIYGPDSWTQNPWVWVIEFEVIKKNIDDVIREMGAA